MRPRIFHSLFRLHHGLTKDDAASTFNRLAESQHVADLRLIFWSASGLMVAGCGFVLIWHKWVDAGGVLGSGALITTIVGIGFGVLAWTYQTGSARLGIVDLFGCEIATICRVLAIAEVAPRYVELFRAPPERPLDFRSQEDYTPVFDANSKDLEVLEARVVERITEFYTYLKAMRDYLRLLGGIAQPRDDGARWQITMRSVIYMLFLMLESARRSLGRLIEYEPEQAQNTITILLSELVAYGFLAQVFAKEAEENPGYDARWERLRLRRERYLELVPAIYGQCLDHADADQWKPAVALLGELDQRYYDVFGERLAPAATATP